MAISLFKYSILSNKPTNSAQNGNTTVQKNEQEKFIKRNTPRELMDFPSGYTITKKNTKTRMSAEDLFDIQYNSGTILSNGARLLRPVSFALGKVDINPTDEAGIYEITVTPTYYRKDSQPVSRTMSEKELIANKALSRGYIKPSSTQTGKYAIAFFDKNGETQKHIATKEECLKLMEENLLYL